MSKQYQQIVKEKISHIQVVILKLLLTQDKRNQIIVKM